MYPVLNAYYEVIRFLENTPDLIFILPLIGIIVSPVAYLFFNKEEVKHFFLGFAILTLFQNTYQAYKLIKLNISTTDFVEFKYLKNSSFFISVSIRYF